MAAKHSNTYTINADMESLRRLLSDTRLMEQIKMTLRQEIGENGSIRYVYDHGMSFTSWGEEVIVSLTPLSNTTTQVFIKSECSMPTQIIDMGKNKQNVNQLYTFIMNNIPRYQAPVQNQPQYAQTNVQSAPQYTQTAPQHTQTATPPAQPASPQKRFCTGCGTQLNPDFAFCPACGTKAI